MKKGIDHHVATKNHLFRNDDEDAPDDDVLDDAEVPSKKDVFLPVTDERFALAVRALHMLVQIDGLIDDVLCSDTDDGPALLLSLLELPHRNDVSARFHLWSQFRRRPWFAQEFFGIRTRRPRRTFPTGARGAPAD